MTPREIWDTLLRILEGIADLCLLSACWLVCCLPVVTVAASSAALYHAVVRTVRQGEGTVCRSFFHAFKENVKQGIWLSLLLAAGVALLIAYNLLGENIPASGGLFVGYWAVVLVLTATIGGTSLYVFPVLSRFRQKTWTILRTSFWLAVGYPLRTLGLLVLLAAFGYVCWRAPLFFLVLPGAFAAVASFLQEPVLAAHTDEGKK